MQYAKSDGIHLERWLRSSQCAGYQRTGTQNLHPVRLMMGVEEVGEPTVRAGTRGKRAR
jgi:hypothetical protein